MSIHLARSPAAGLLAAILAGLLGCGGERPYPVKGQLVYADDKQPVKELAGFSVTFTSEKLQKSAHGTIDEEGRFELSATSRGNDGAFPGTYKVILTQPHPNAERRITRKPIVDVAYEHPDKTNLNATVEAKSNEFTFELKRIGKK